MRGRPRGATVVLGLIVTAAVLALAVVWTVSTIAARAQGIATEILASVLGRALTIGTISGDPWSGVVLEHVSLMSERPGDPPLLSVRRLVMHLDARGVIRDLARRRGVASSVVRNISQIVLDEPEVRVTRNASGVWELPRVLDARPGAASAGFAGRIIVLDGRVTLTDRSRTFPRTFEARFADLNGTADFRHTPRVRLRASFVEVRDGRRISGRLHGAYLLDRRVLDVDLHAAGLDAAVWGHYLLTTPAFRVTGGQVDAQVHILRTPRGSSAVTDVRGRLIVRDGRAFFTRRSVDLSGIWGEIAIADRAISTERLRGILDGARVEVRGAASFYGEPWLDIAARADGVDLARLGRLFFPGLDARLSGRARGEVWITGPISGPRLEGRIHSARGWFDRQPFDRASATIALYGGLFGLLDARLASGGGMLSGTGLWTVGAPHVSLNLQAHRVAASSLRPWTPEALSALDGRVHGAVTVVRQGPTVAAAGRVSLDAGRLRGVTVDALDASFRMDDPRTIALESMTVRRGGGFASATGTVSSRGALTLDTVVRIPDVASLPFLRLPGDPRGHLDFSGRVMGTLQAPELTGVVLAREAQLGGVTFDSGAGRIALRRASLVLDGVAGRSGTSRYRVAGTIRWPDGPGASGGPSLAIDLEAERAQANTLARAMGVDLPMSGWVAGRIRLDGPLPKLSASGSLSLREAEVLGQQVDVANAAFRWDGSRLTLEGTTVRRRDSVIRVAGTVDRRAGLGLEVSGSGLDLRDVARLPAGPVRLEGRLDLVGRVQGPLSSPAGEFQVSTASLAVNGQPVEAASGIIRWADRQLDLDPVTLHIGDERYAVTGQVRLDGTPRLSLLSTVTGGRLSTLVGLGGWRLQVPLDGIVHGTARVDGPLATPAARLELAMPSGRLGDHPLSGRADLALRDGAVAIEDLEFTFRQGRIAAAGRYDLRGESQVEVSGSDLELDVLRPLLRLRRPLLGRLTFTTQLSGTLAAPELGLDVEISKGGVAGTTIDSLVVSGFYRDGLLHVVQGLLTQDGHKVRATGSMPFNPKALRFDDHAPMDVRVHLANVNLSLLRLVTDGVEDARGDVSGTFTIGGSLAAPRLDGGLRVDGGTLRLRGVRTPIESVTLDLAFETEAIRLRQASARVGGGTARLDGTMLLSLRNANRAVVAIAPDRPLALELSNVRLDLPPLANAAIDGSLRFWGTPGDARAPLTVGGRLVISDGTITLAERPPLPGGIAPLALQGIQFVAGRDLAVQAGGVRVAVRPGESLLLSGSTAAPVLEGTVEAERGPVTVLGNTFVLQEGRATFRPAAGVRPQITAVGVTQIGPTRVVLEVHGWAPDALTLDLRSDPALSQPEILALLARQSGLSDLLTGDIAGLLRTEVTRRLLTPVTLALRRALGLSELTLDYDVARPLRLVVGRLLLPNLYLTATTTFEAQQRWLWALEYRFAQGWHVAFRIEPDGRPTAIFWYSARH